MRSWAVALTASLMITKQLIQLYQKTRVLGKRIVRINGNNIKLCSVKAELFQSTILNESHQNHPLPKTQLQSFPPRLYHNLWRNFWTSGVKSNHWMELLFGVSH